MLHLVLFIDATVALICSSSKIRIYNQGGMQMLKQTVNKAKAFFDCWVVKAVLLVLGVLSTPSLS